MTGPDASSETETCVIRSDTMYPDTSQGLRGKGAHLFFLFFLPAYVLRALHRPYFWISTHCVCWMGCETLSIEALEAEAEGTEGTWQNLCGEAETSGNPNGFRLILVRPPMYVMVGRPLGSLGLCPCLLSPQPLALVSAVGWVGRSR